MKGNNALKILEGMKVAGWPGVYVLGCIDRRVTIYSQQVRALNLAAALVANDKKLAGGDTVVVVGAGAAGLTCAAGLRRLGANVIVLEIQREILKLFRGGSTRWLHPGVYDWPLDGWDRDRAELPLLDWEHGSVDAVRQQLEAGWNAARDGIGIHLDVGKVSIGSAHEEPRKVVWNNGSTRTRTVVLALGFGLEATPLPRETRYWENDDLDEDPVDGRPRKWLVSGSGDGALTDLFRLCIDEFRHDRMLHDFVKDSRMERIRQEIRAIEDNAEILGDPAQLHDAYERLDAPWIVEALRARPRFDEVKLATPTGEFLTRNASPLNRFLAGQLRKAGRFVHVPYKVESADADRGKVAVRYGDDTIETFDRIQRRHGPESALAVHFPKIDQALKADREYRRAKPTLTDQTRERLWAEGAFGPERSSTTGRTTETQPKSETTQEKQSTASIDEQGGTARASSSLIRVVDNLDRIRQFDRKLDRLMRLGARPDAHDAIESASPVRFFSLFVATLVLGLIATLIIALIQPCSQEQDIETEDPTNASARRPLDPPREILPPRTTPTDGMQASTATPPTSEQQGKKPKRVTDVKKPADDRAEPPATTPYVCTSKLANEQIGYSWAVPITRQRVDGVNVQDNLSLYYFLAPMHDFDNKAGEGPHCRKHANKGEERLTLPYEIPAAKRSENMLCAKLRDNNGGNTVSVSITKCE
jgi:hypothetical protein